MDVLIKGTGDGLNFLAVDSTEVVRTAQKLDNLSITASVALGRLLTAGLLLGSQMKNARNKLTLRINGDGPLGNITVVATQDGKVKGTISNAQQEVMTTTGKGFDIPRAIGKGLLTLVRDEGLKVPYQGQVELQTSQIAQDIAYLLQQSEQIASVVVLGVLINQKAEILQAGGFIVQLTPGATESVIAQLEEKMRKFPNFTDLMDMGYSIDEIIERFVVEAPQILAEIPVFYECDCNQERFKNGIKLLQKKEIEEILEEKGKIKATCSFCGKIYEFGKEDLGML